MLRARERAHPNPIRDDFARGSRMQSYFFPTRLPYYFLFNSFFCMQHVNFWLRTAHLSTRSISRCTAWMSWPPNARINFKPTRSGGVPIICFLQIQLTDSLMCCQYCSQARTRSWRLPEPAARLDSHCVLGAFRRGLRPYCDSLGPRYLILSVSWRPFVSRDIRIQWLDMHICILMVSPFHLEFCN